MLVERDPVSIRIMMGYTKTVKKKKKRNERCRLLVGQVHWCLDLSQVSYDACRVQSAAAAKLNRAAAKGADGVHVDNVHVFSAERARRCSLNVDLK